MKLFVLTAVIIAACTPSIWCETATEAKVNELHKTVEALSRQVMLQQQYIEERIRSGGSSGIKQIRHLRDGTRPYYSESHTLKAVAAIHDHSNYIRTVGLGEFVAVLNGVEFRTRHNDYRLYMPSKSSKTYHETEDIPFPDVPKSVLDKTSVDEQIKEMREYFRAWSKQDTSIRDYKPYFKPVLCYLEGAWTTETKTLEEPFSSDRHHIDASSWFDLQDKIRYTSMTGLKDNMENYAYLPTSIVDVIGGVPRYAQWNYRIVCHPLNRAVPLDRFKVVDDLAARMAKGLTLEEYEHTRAARFRLNGRNARYDKEAPYSYGVIDSLMYEIPGKDNYKGNINETSFNVMAYKAEKNFKQVLNAARYHRVFRVNLAGAGGLTSRHRGFKDEYLFTALNEQSQISPFSVNSCHRNKGVEACEKFESRVSYAIPLEILYLTPLHEWNPYNLDYKEGDDASTVTANERNGGSTPDTAYNGTNSRVYYRTPAAMFEGGEVDKDAADTTKDSTHVLDKKGNVQKVVASGMRIFLPNIPGVGSLRTRYPIMPIHDEYTSIGKEVDALKEILMKQETYKNMMYESTGGASVGGSTGGDGGGSSGNGWIGTVTFIVGESTSTTVKPHHHEIYVAASDLKQLNDETVKFIGAYTTMDGSHQHRVDIAYNATIDSYYIMRCGIMPECPGGHSKTLTRH